MGAASGLALSAKMTRTKPNIVIVFLDDSGFSDYPPFGNPKYPAPNVARLARQGCSFRNFYVPQAVCSASRSALMTGCYPGRTKVFGAHPPRARGLEPTFATMGEVLKKAGYKTACFGKWHLGDQPDTRPPARGFDESCGLMYSNDMWEFHPQRAEVFRPHALQFWENGKIKIERVTPEHQPMLTTWYTQHAVDFISRHKEEPFLLYVPHTMPHVPLFASKTFAGKSGAGVYGDVMMELDWSIGEIMQALKRAGLEDDTLFILTSDNGPWRSYGNHAGKTPFRESKLTSFNGGLRSACIMRYPKQLKAGSVSTNTFCSVDLMPTIAHLAGAPLPEHPIDGKNIWDFLSGKPGASNPHEYYAFSTGANFDGVMSGDGRWKLHVPHPYQKLLEEGNDGSPGKFSRDEIGLSLFDLTSDPLETKNVLEAFPEVATKLQAFAEDHRKHFYRKSDVQ
jgi:arylsulfatase A-like enzyme